MPKISVIIPTYNSAQYLPETLQSLFDQTFKDFEVIVVDDGSTDNTHAVVSSFNSDKIRYIFQQNNGGPSRARNMGIKIAKGQYISFFDSDDIMLPDKLERSVNFLDSNPRLGLIFTNCLTNYIKPGEINGTYKNRLLTGYDRFWSVRKKEIGNNCYIIKSQDAFEILFFENYISTSSIVIPRSVLTHVGDFDESLRSSEDRDMWFRITKHYAIGYIDIIGHQYRLREKSITFILGPNLSENRIKVFRKQLKNNPKPLLRQQAIKHISKNLFGIGYQFQQNEKMKKARTYYLLCLKEHLSWYAIRGIIITLLPSKFYRLLKK